MPSRQVVAKELAEVFKVLSHPDRIRLIEDLQHGEKDVNTLAETLGLPGPRVSQHLSLMKAHRLVEEQRDGRYHRYHLTQPGIAQWIIDGVAFLEKRAEAVPKSKLNAARRLWTSQ